MDKTIKTFIKRYGLDEAISIIAVSGGADSVVLLDILAKALPAEKLIVAHINHGLRKASFLEAGYVRGLAEGLHLKYFETTLRLGKTSEATSREKRYGWLRQLAQKQGAKYIITAHHLDDQVETLLLNITRGTGPLEAWGMRELERGILRPLLDFPKSDLVEYAKTRHLKFFEDQSNLDVKYSRNRIRHEVVPTLEKINPNLKQTIRREISLAHQMNDFFEDHIAKVEKKLTSGDRLDLIELKRQPVFIAKEIIRRKLHQKTGRKDSVYQKNVESVMDLLQTSGTKKTYLGKLMVTKTYKYLIFGDKPTQKLTERGLVLNKWVSFGGFLIRARIGTGKATKNNILLPVGFSDNLKVRTWQTGDRIEAKFGTKKIQDVFGDAKIEVSERYCWPLVTSHGNIVWVPRLIAGKSARKNNKNLIIEVK
jgi:tRNA(Ile)-lysidine synthase